MNTQPSPKIIGAFLIGFALVGGAYVTANFGKAPAAPQLAQTANQTQTATIRTAIEVFDEDGNGIEDWRDEFLSFDPVVVENTISNYKYPETITGRLGINFIQDAMLAQGSGNVPRTNEEIVEQNIRAFERETLVRIYDTPDVTLIRSNEGEVIRTYANQLATAIIENSQTNLDFELLILRDVLNRNDANRAGELGELAEIYRLTRDAVVEVPVPTLFVKEHLDLINGLHAVHHDVRAMSFALDDPAYSLIRLQKYEGDVFGMVRALENIYISLEPYASLFTAEDPAVFFVQFSPNSNVRI